MFTLPLLLLSSLLHITTSNVYNVTPDDHYYPNTTCHHCHNLQHYLLNTTKYFTSNTQLFFLTGLHHLHTDLIIQNVHNISLIGSTTNGTTPDTVIQCNSSVGIVMTNITNLIATNITIRSCLGNEYNNATVLIKQCTNVQLRHVVIEESHNSYGIVGINILGDSHFSYITNNAMITIYNDTTVDMENHSLTIDHYHINDINNAKAKVKVTFNQQTYKVRVSFINSSIQFNYVIFHIRYNNTGLGKSTVIIKSCSFSNNHDNLLYIKSYTIQQGNAVCLENCSVSNHYVNPHMNNGVIHIKSGPDIHIANCRFTQNKNVVILTKVAFIWMLTFTTKVTITNTTFSHSIGNLIRGFVMLENVDLHLRGPIIFKNISNSSSIIELRYTNITSSNYIEFANISTESIFDYQLSHLHTYPVIYMEECTKLNITQNNVLSFVSHRTTEPNLYEHPPCYFQYLSDVSLDDQYSSHNYSILLDDSNKWLVQRIVKNLPTTHCRWLPGSAFNTAMPLEVNSKYIRYVNQSGIYNSPSQLIVKKKNLCFCDTEISYDCYKDLLDAIYPGQTMTLNIHPENVNTPKQFKSYNSIIIITVVNDADWLPSTACIVTNSSELTKTIKNGIRTSLKYTIAFPTQGWCELYLKGFSDGDDVTDIYYIEQLPCPPGFVKKNGVCQCPSFLYKFNIKCNINDQTLQRPANIWIVPIPHKTYSLSLHCPFHYCLPYSSHLHFSTPNSQCQFNRSGILCGHCQQGLSTVFGSSHCQQCSNIYLFLIVPIAIAGLVLVLLLFILNLTVTDGTINAFILYVNIIIINTPVFFPPSSEVTPAHTFISLANLDLGIQTCFYNGMDDYAKMWLQLAFPFYLIFIATSLIITSRYSTTIQRLTARRALPVLATLFLLSYTKILLTISSVLFYYSKIIHLPSEHTTMVWSVDANVPLFGVKFAILFITCIVFFSFLLPFNIILLFTKTLSRFKFIKKFKPLLDAYQGPYKIKFYYWTGIQLVIRVVFYGISSLDRNINLTISIMLLTIIAVLQGWFRPFKIKFKNLNELMFIIYLQMMFLILLYSQDTDTSTNIVVAIAAVQFTFIIIYHIITYTCNGVIRHRIQKIAATTNVQLAMLFNLGKVRYYEDIHVPPKVYFNKMREPLVNFDL
ncbi:uncharacterized protein [Dysidea avara]|uniref:uncharacterized protein n=1 Tax=Dysidea avara TaxID=196820 RepID=UPI00332E869D